jgi:hypothetical protein
MAIIKTANGHQTSLLVSQHIPDFVRSDHPKFVTFIEKYYEFLANNSVMQTSDGTNYYGADYASKAISDIHDIDTTDIDLFVESFRKQYAVNFPSSVYNTEDTRILYKNILDFYRAVGTEDSFKMLFRLIYNEDIEIYYPKEDMLIASGGNYVQQVRVKLRHVDDLNNIENAKIIGKTSGAYGTVETVDVLPPQSISHVPGKIGKTSSIYTSGQANTEIYDSEFLSERMGREASVTLTNQHGTFDIYEEVYYVQNNATITSVSNTTILPLTTNLILSENFGYAFANSVISFDDGLHYKSNSSQHVPWGTANIGFANTGLWHATGPGQGEVQIYANTLPGVTGVLRIGNNSVGSPTSDLRHLVYSKNIPIYSDNTIYKLSVTARDVGGDSGVAFAEGNRFSAGVVCIRHDLDKIGSDYQNTYENPLWLASHQQSIDDNFFTYTAYFKGRQQSHDIDNVYPSTNYGSGGRTDLTSGTRYYNSLRNAINDEVLLPFNTTWFKPTIKVNEPASGVTNSRGITEIRSIQLEEIGSMQSNFDKGTGGYRDDASLLSTKGAHLSDGNYRQIYAYDIRSQQQMKDYNTVVRKTAHPSGLKMFGTKITESYATETSSSYANTNLSDSFSPYTINSLAGWWKADALGPVNIEWKKFTPDANNASNGIFGTNTNRMTAGGSLFEDRDANYLQRIDSRTSAEAAESIHVEYTNLSAPPVGGKQSLKITDVHIDSDPQVLLGPTSALGGYRYNRDYDDHGFGIVLDPGKTWLVSCYAMTSNLTSDTTGVNSFQFNFHSSNTSGYLGSNKTSGIVEPFAAVNTWERKANTIDMSSGAHINTTRTFLKFIFPDRRSHGVSTATGNTYYLIDGIMIEEYDSAIHGATPPFTPSPYVRPGLNGSNVLSWYDQSVNEHHVYANTHGGIFYNPQFIANAVNGMPAVRFSSNTVNATSLRTESTGFWATNLANVHPHSSIGGTVNSIALHYGDSTANKPPTVALQSKTMLASNTLSRPVSNSWTIIAVAKSNLMTNKYEYGLKNSTGDVWKGTLFSSGYTGSPSHEDDASPLEIMKSSGAMDFSVYPSDLQSENGKFRTLRSNGSTVSSVYSPAFGTHTNSFSIFGISQYAGSSTSDGLNFHFNGRRYANSELTTSATVENSFNFENNGMIWDDQRHYRTSIGGWAPSNNQSWDTGTNGVNLTYAYGSDIWDGDIAEVLVFNEKLTNTNIAFVEGYLAWKYGLQDSLVHKDGASASNTYAYNWNFTSSYDGWKTSHGALTKNANDLQLVGLGASNPDAIQTDFGSEPIDGGGFQNVKIRFKRNKDGNGTWAGKLRWKTTRSGEDVFADGARSITFTSEPSDTGYHDYYITSSDLTSLATNWANSMITALEVEFTVGPDSAVTYNIDEISVYDTRRKSHHPFRYDSPSDVRGFANNWYRDY